MYHVSKYIYTHQGYNHGSRPTFGSYDCYDCGEPGHLARNCRNRRHAEEKKARQGKQDSYRNFNDGGYDNDQRDPTFNCLSSVCFLAKKTNDWYADSGATHHMTDQRHFFTTFKPVKPGTWHVYGIGSIKMEVHGIGNIEIHSYVKGEKNVGVLNDALFVPGIGANLFCLGTAMDRKLKADFEGDVAIFKDKKTDTAVMEGQKIGKSLYHMKFIAVNADQEVVANSAQSTFSLTRWHRRYAHASQKIIKKMANIGAVDGLILDTEEGYELKICEGCIFGGMHRSPFPTSESRATEIGELIHSDVGFVNVPTPNNETCYALFKDDFSGYTKVYLMKSKGEADEKFLFFVSWLELTTGNKLKKFRTDGGVEYFKNKKWREERGIVHQKSNRYTPQQNGRSERENRRIIKPTRKTIHMRNTQLQSTLLKKGNKRTLELWGGFLLSTVYVLNRTISSRSNMTPYEMFFNKKPNVANLRVMGCRAYVHVPEQLRKKLDSKAQPGWLVGYGEDTKGWIIWEPI